MFTAQMPTRLDSICFCFLLLHLLPHLLKFSCFPLDSSTRQLFTNQQNSKMSNIQEIPSIITTSHLLLRGIIPAFIGCSIGDNDEKGGKEKVRASAFQMTYRKDLNKISAENGKLFCIWY